MGHFQNNKEQNRQSSTEIESIDGKKERKVRNMERREERSG